MSLMKANLDPTIEIKEIDKDNYHVEFLRFMPRMDEPSRPDEIRDIQIFTPKAWEAMKRIITSKKGLGIKVLNYHENRIIHDPELATRKAQKAVEIAEAEKKAKEEADSIAQKEAEEAELKVEQEKKEAQEKTEAEAEAKAKEDEVEKAKKAVQVQKAKDARAKKKAEAEAEKQAEAEEKAANNAGS